MFEDQRTGGVGLGMEGVEAHDAAVEVEPRAEVAGGGDFVALVGHHHAAEVVLAGDGDGGEDLLAAGVVGFLAVEDHEFFGRGRAAHLGLEGAAGAFDGEGVHLGVEAAEGGLAGGGVAAGEAVGADAQGAALALGEALGEGGEVFLPARGAGQMGAGDDGQERPEGIGAEAGAVVGHGAEVGAEGLEFGRGLGGVRRGFGGDGGEGGAEVFGLETAAGVFAKFAHEEAFGLVVPDVEVAGVPAGAVGLAQFGPAAGGVKRAGVTLGVDEGFDEENRVLVAGLPVGAEAGQDEAEGFGGEVGDGFMGEKEAAGVVDDEGEAATALFLGPANPVVAVAQAPGGGAEDEDAEPVAGGVGEGVVEAFADGVEGAEIVVLLEEFVTAGQFVGGEEAGLEAVEDELLSRGEQAGGRAHPRRVKSRGREVQSRVLTHVNPACCRRQ